MAVLDGYVVRSADSGVTNERLSLGLHDLEYLDWPTRTSIVGHDLRTAFAYVDNLPVSQPGYSLAGTVPISFFDDFYNRVHIRPQTIALGYVITAETEVVDVWNAYLTDVHLASIDGLAEGLSVTGSTSYPVTFSPLQMSAYEVSVTPEGPVSFDVTLTWAFSDGNDPALRISGSRALPWHFPANWQTPIKEKLSWLTDVLRAEDGSEQRYALRSSPRWGVSFAFEMGGQLRRIFENKLFDLGGQAWAVPVWQDGTRLAAAVSAGASSVPVDTATRNYEVDGVAILMTDDGLSFEAFEIEAVAADALTLVRPLLQSWPAGTWIYPARISRFVSPPKLTSHHAGYLSGSAEFESVLGAAGTYAAESSDYRGYPVLTDRPNWRDGVGMSYRRQLAVFDAMVGAAHVLDRSNVAEPAQDVTWTAFGRDEADSLRGFLYARAGRHKGIWVPTWAADIVPVSTIGTSDLSWQVQACGYPEHTGGANRRDVRIELTDGTIFYRRITGASTVSDSVESISLDTALGATVTADAVQLISWMTFCRLDDDSVEIEWPSATIAEASFTLTGPRNGV